MCRLESFPFGYDFFIVQIYSHGNLVRSCSGFELPFLPQAVMLNALTCIFLRSY